MRTQFDFDRDWQLYVDGEFRDSESGETLTVTDPATDEAFATAPDGTAADADAAVDAANRATEAWKWTEPSERAELLFEIADHIEAHHDELVALETRENDAAWFIDPAWGIGIKFSRFGSAASMGNTVVTFEDGSSAYGTMSDDITITFVGPSYISKYNFTNPDHLLYGGVSLGYIGYKNEFFLINDSFELNGATVGGAIDLGYDYSISKHITIGAQAAVTGGVLSKINMIDGHSETTLELEEENRENLSRIDISAGVRVRI